MDKQFFVYMMASDKRGTIYTGVTSKLVARVWQHRTHAIADSFSARYGVTRLVWFEEHGNAESAIMREKQIKEWRRAWKVELIEKGNPQCGNPSSQMGGWEGVSGATMLCWAGW